MKTLLTITCAFMLSATLLFGDSAETFRQANAHHAAGRHAEAADLYEKLLEDDGPRVAVLRNLGSSYFQMGENGRSILAFKRALVLEPRDPDLLANLKLAQDQAAVYPPKNDALWPSFLKLQSARSWSIAALVSAILLPLAAAAWTARKGKFRPWIAATAGLALTLLGLALAGMSAWRDQEHRGIVIAKSATVRISPFKKAADRGTLPEGRELKLGRKHDGYRWITSADGSLEGWVAIDQIAPLIPRSKN